MIGRRRLLSSGAAFALLPRAWAASARLSFRGSLDQGGLVIGQTEPGASVLLNDKPMSLSPDGLFVFGLAYDAEKPLHVTAHYRDGTDEASEIQARKRQYDIQSITGLPEKLVEPPPEIAKQIAHEHELIWMARQADTAGLGFSEPLDWPFAGRLSGIYGSQRILNGTPKEPHLAVDVAAPEGTPIHAAADGIVSIADDFHLEGGFTLLDHGHGVSTCYLHQSKRLVAAGDNVRRGDVIGLVGMTGRATGPHCHWGLCWFQLKLDPSRATRTPEPPKA